MSSYIKFLSRNKLYTVIEAIGLSVSLAFVVIIFCYVTQHVAVTRENPQRKSIYCLSLNDITLFEYGMKETIGESIPEVEAVAEVGWLYGTPLKVDGQMNKMAQVMGCDRDFFNLFPVQFAEGQPDRIDEVQTAFVSESLAQTLWESGDAIGQTIHLLNRDFTVAGVFADIGSSLFYNNPDVVVNVDISDGIRYYGGLDGPGRPANKFENVWVFVKAAPQAER
ncbi:MAG: ABC transporter permease, partial [Bacteroidales bacterium]|nr:ABC transporter permease [Bacteroidales bacterium]